MSSFREERRKDRAAEAEAKRADQIAAAEAEAVRLAAMSQARRAATEQQHAHEQARAEAKQAAKDKRADRRRAAVAGLRAWAAGHVVDLLIYPLAVVSAIMAVPAMAAYGAQVYGTATGYALPVISELGMWAFALAVQASRTRDPQRPVWALQMGVWAFAAVAFGLNTLHGLHRGPSAGVVMGVASVAGVLAHQLVTAAPRRSRTQRQEARITRLAERKTKRIRQAAVRQAVAEIDTTGNARLVYAPGRYVLAGRGKRRLQAAIVPGLPVEAAIDDDLVNLAGWDRELSDLLATDRPSIEPDASGVDPGAVATLDGEGEQQKSSPDRGVIGGRVGRSIEQLRAELRAAIEDDPTGIDPTSAESIRKALRCAPKYARQLRDEYRQGGRP
ncbi:hypothetical protein FHU38_004648 [Saccharomonospora amisosensis]|uniref:Uncharacterized protein n=1 Tax=Saccharomonospora amisosensis TaxID=1128677 RepID=A0A7X5ZST3_9PSEU|nr:hypothetical protein [Saccharomonospora amisosensis]NIJ14304.1 hypothetical protein [Saccharomonospora amisosensis]